MMLVDTVIGLYAYWGIFVGLLEEAFMLYCNKIGPQLVFIWQSSSNCYVTAANRCCPPASYGILQNTSGRFSSAVFFICYFRHSIIPLSIIWQFGNTPFCYLQLSNLPFGYSTASDSTTEMDRNNTYPESTQTKDMSTIEYLQKCSSLASRHCNQIV
jgi:hypothetical protein